MAAKGGVGPTNPHATGGSSPGATNQNGGTSDDSVVQPSMRRAVTSVDVANEAGVSQATVARTYSSPERVSPATRDRVHAAAERIGYVPNAIARSLKSKRTNIVGAVVPANGEYWQSVLTELSQQLAAQNRQLLLFSFAEHLELDDVLASVAQYRLDALVLASANIERGQVVQMAASGVPLVAFNQPDAASLVHSVSVDNETGMAVIAQHLVSRGVSTVTFVGGIASASTDRLRYQGAARVLGANGIACPYVEAGAYSYESGYKVGATIAQHEEHPEVVIVASDEVAFGVIDGLRTAGLSVPDDLMVTGFDGLPQSAWAGYDLTTLVQPTDVLVRRALDLVLPGEGTSPSTRPANLVVEGTLRLGSSTSRGHDIGTDDDTTSAPQSKEH